MINYHNSLLVEQRKIQDQFINNYYLKNFCIKTGIDPDDYKLNRVYLDQIRQEVLEYYEQLRMKYAGNIENMLDAMRANIEVSKYEYQI